MVHQIKDNWIINNQNIFGLEQDICLSLFSIQVEVLNQIEGKDIDSFADYLGAEVNISKKIPSAKNMTIKKMFSEFLTLEFINFLDQSTYKCGLILRLLQITLLKEYTENKHKNILTLLEFETQYNFLLTSFLTSNIDTDEQDFIKAELNLCNNLLTELNKPVYNGISLLNELLDKPCEFKENLFNSTNKRKKFLEQKVNEKYSQVKTLPLQPIKTKADILKEQLSQYGFFELEKVKTLSEQSKDSIIEKIAESGLPYAIAMFDYLQFISYLEKKHFDSKYKLNIEVSKWFDRDKKGRAVKGNISSLLKNTTENKDRYTAYTHKENVIKDYEQLK